MRLQKRLFEMLYFGGILSGYLAAWGICQTIGAPWWVSFAAGVSIVCTLLFLYGITRKIYKLE